MLCKNCQNEIDDNANFCIHCGAKIEKDVNNEQNAIIEEPYQNKKAIVIISLIVGLFILLCICFGIFNNKSNNSTGFSNTKEENKDYSQDIILQWQPHGIYVYKINRDAFDKDEFVKFAQKLPRSESGDSSMIFVFDKDIAPNTKNVIIGLANTNGMNMPLYTSDVLWKQYPYFYYSYAFGIKQYYCEINGLEQKYYERNQAALYNETEFTNKWNLTAPSGFGLSSLNGCNPEYKADNYTVSMEMKLGTIFAVNFKDQLQTKSSNANPAQKYYKDFIEQDEKNFITNASFSKNNDLEFSKLQKKYIEAINNLNEKYYDNIDPNDSYYKNNWVKILGSEGSDYYEINYDYMIKKYGKYLSPANNIWLKHLSETESIVDDAALTTDPDSIRKYIILLEQFLKEYPTFVSKNDVKDRIKGYLNVYLLGMDNSPIFDKWDSKKLNPGFKASYEKFLSENKDSKYYQMVEEIYNKAKSNNFNWDENFDDWLMNTYHKKYFSD